MYYRAVECFRDTDEEDVGLRAIIEPEDFYAMKQNAELAYSIDYHMDKDTNASEVYRDSLIEKIKSCEGRVPPVRELQRFPENQKDVACCELLE
eukprot:gene14514-21719_t